MSKLLVWVFVFIVLSSFISAEVLNEQATKDGNSYAFFSNVEYVQEDGKWKHISEAKSLKDYYKIVYLEKDDNFKVRIIDINYTSVEIEFEVTEAKENKNIPIEIWKDAKQDKDLKDFKKDRIKEREEILVFKESKLTKKYDNIEMSDIFLFGDATTVYMFAPDSTVATDTFIDSNDNGNNFGITDNYLIGTGGGPEYGKARFIMNWSYICDTIPADEDITTAKLQIHTVAVAGLSTTDVFPINCSWVEGTQNNGAGYSNWDYGINGGVTWGGTDIGCRRDDWNLTQNKPFPTTAPANEPFNITLDYTYFDQLCKGNLDTVTQNKGIILISNENPSTTEYGYIYSSDDGTASHRPMLFINTTLVVPNCSVSYPLNLGAYDTPDINYSCTNFDDILHYYVYINNTLNQSGITGNVTGWIAPEGWYNVTVHADNGTTNSSNSSGTKFAIDRTAPIINGLVANVSSPQSGTTVLFNATITDLTASYYKFAWNSTGTMTNKSAQSVSSSIVSTPKNISTKWTANYVCWQYWVNDTRGFSTSSAETCFYVSPVLFNFSSGAGDYPGVHSLNISFWDEETNEKIASNVDLDIAFNVWRANYQSTNWDYSFGLSGRHNYSIGIFPNSTNVFTDATFDYELAGYEQRNYYLTDATLNNITSDLKLYLVSEGNATRITFYILEQLSTLPIADATIKVQRYYTATNSFKTVEIGKTDYNGVTSMQLVYDTVLYRFIIEKDGVVLKTTTKNKITATNIYIYVTLVDPFLQTYDDVTGVTHSLIWTNATTTFDFTWSDSSGLVQTACLDVTKKKNTGETLLSTQCESTTSGTLTYQITEPLIGDFWARTYVNSEDGDRYYLDVMNIHHYQASDIFGKYGTFLFILFLGTISFAGAFNPLVAIVFSLLGFGAGIALGFISVGYGVLIILAIIGGILIYKIRT